MAAEQPSSLIEKCGYLMIKRPPHCGKVRIKAWQSKYFVLRHSPPVLDYYKDELSAHSPKSDKEKYSISLNQNVVHIGTTDASRTHHHAFMIVTNKHGALTLASENDELTQEWVDALSRVVQLSSSTGEVFADVPTPDYERTTFPSLSPQGSPELAVKGAHGRRVSGHSLSDRRPSGHSGNDVMMQGFPVTSRFTPSADKNSLHGPFMMLITDKHVTLHKEGFRMPVVSWPLTGLRGWKCDPAETPGDVGKQLLTLESGRKSLTGEGVFQFFTSHGDQITELIRTRSTALFASAIGRRERFKHERSCSYEDLPTQPAVSPSVKMPRGNTFSAKQRRIMSARLPSVRKRSDSDSQLDSSSKPAHLSPASMKKELLRGLERGSNESIGNDEVFIEHRRNLSRVVEVDKFKEQLQENAYLDLVVDENAEPIHISDPDPRRDSGASVLSEEGGTGASEGDPCGTNDNSETERADYVDESRIKSPRFTTKKRPDTPEATETHEKENPYSDTKDIQQCYANPDILRQESQAKEAKDTSDAQKQFSEDFFAQLTNPMAHKTPVFPVKTPGNPTTGKPKSQSMIQKALNSKSKPEKKKGGSLSLGRKRTPRKQEAKTLEIVCRTKMKRDDQDNLPVKEENEKTTKPVSASNSELGPKVSDAPPLSIDDSKAHKKEKEEQSKDLGKGDSHTEEKEVNVSSSKPVEVLPKAVDTSDIVLDHPSTMGEILEKVLSQMETPQSADSSPLSFTLPKRNSTGSVATENNVKENLKLVSTKSCASQNSELSVKKQVEKSKSHSGSENKRKELQRPPPLPLRPVDMPGTPRTRASASMGDIFEDLHRRPDGGGFERNKTFFAKGINMPHPSISGGHNLSALSASFDPESHHATRLLMRSGTGAQIPAELIGSPPPQDTQNGFHSPIPVVEGERPRSKSLRHDAHLGERENVPDEDRVPDEDENKKRRGSKATKMLSKILKSSMALSPTVTRRRASYDACHVPGIREFQDLKNIRKGSLTPGIVNEGWSPDAGAEATPSEGSPKLSVRNRTLRRASNECLPDGKRANAAMLDERVLEEQRQKARARERERAELRDAHEPPPALPPRKVSEPPPLPPRRKKSSSEESSSPTTPPRRRSQDHAHFSPVTRKISGGMSRSISAFRFDEQQPPPVPPRGAERRGSQAPSIQLTSSSPEQKQREQDNDPMTRRRSSGEGVCLPQISGAMIRDNTVPTPVPKRPPKSKDLFNRHHVDRNSQLSDSDEPAYIDRREYVPEKHDGAEKHGKQLRRMEHVAYEQGSSAFSAPTSGNLMDAHVTSRDVTLRDVTLDPGLSSEIHRDEEDEELSPTRYNLMEMEKKGASQRARSVSPKSSGLAPELMPITRKLSAGSLGVPVTRASTETGHSPGHTPPLPHKFPQRGGVLVLSDSGSTTPISV